MIKNLIICALSVTCAILTVRLWFGNFLIHGLFPGDPLVAASPAHQRMAQEMIESGKMTVNFDGTDESYELSYKVVYSGIREHAAWEISTRAISALIDEGGFDRSGALDGTVLNEISARNNIVIQYNFAMPTSFFREQFGQRPGFLSSVFSDFDTLAISPNQGAINFYFISNENMMFHAFILSNGQIYNDFSDYFVQGPQYASSPSPSNNLFIRSHNPIDPIGGQMLHGTVRPFVLFFFPNPAVASEGVTVNGVYTYMDNARVVKFYPNNVVEYNALLNTRPSGTVSLASSLLAALDMLDRDRASMQTLGEPMNDVFLTGYSIGPAEGQWNFYFNYIAGGRPMDIDDDIGILSHAVEIRVINNSVLQYRRLVLNFLELTVEGL